ncbi:hypothetical protein KO529_09665 [Arenibacter algicola]|uniref:hypothetical protein n=1 Tax=Arenibacter algicola TaxID=616991 RepID=UPI001C067D8B|nr:hypothetical protein [Arenibacter algicola]MBU2905050.1 hypothetical protein [Arenibacter algicola]
MKTQMIVIGLVLLMGSACTEEQAEELLGNLGKSDCYKNLDAVFDLQNERYQRDAFRENVDDEGNTQSLKTCKRGQVVANETIRSLKFYSNSGTDGCTGEEILEIEARYADRIIELNEDLESTWNRCEEVYGSE